MTLSVFQSTVTDQSGDVQAGAEIEVVNEATGLPATLYSTRGGAATTNPMFADADGFAQFYTDPGEYRITATSGVFSKTWRYVRIGDAGGNDAATVARNGDYMAYGGTANAITLTSTNTLPNSTLNVGDRIRFKATITNTGPTTIAVDGGPNTACVTPTGGVLPAGFIRTDVITECEYDGANFVVSRKIESGSNANGEWTKWEDGRAEVCKVEVGLSISCTTPSGNVFIDTSIGGGVLPITLTSATCKRVFAESGNVDGASRWIASDSNLSSTNEFPKYRVMDSISSSSSMTIYSSVSGKWY